MGFACGIVGLPNVGKSTLFNALTATQAAQAANYPFTTIEPNVGKVSVPDVRLDKLSELAKSAKVVPTQLSFVDIAGLVKGASQGEGLGNQFLGHIREVDAVLHLVRCFEDGNVVHVAGRVDPVADSETIETELMLADMESLERRIRTLEKTARNGDKEAKATLPVVTKVLDALKAGTSAGRVVLTPDETATLHTLALLTAKPVLYVCNVSEAEAANGNAFTQRMEAKAKAEGRGCVVISAALEAEVAQLADAAERLEYLSSLGLKETGLTRVIRAGYELLGLITFLTAGPQEARAWTIPKGIKAPAAAGQIHSDLERGFIRAEVIAYDDYVKSGGEAQARAAGKLRSEGKEYVVQDGDVIVIKFAV
ncbi:MAG: redox-regulated ATPase YchF [Alphaproteobacteria bacterium]|nr:redox-regulated ATPase YchF [Alphaproteobacteria bacterium]